MSLADPSERAHWISVLKTFTSYRTAALSGNQLRRRDFYSLAQHQRELIGDAYKKLLDDADWCIRANADFCDEIASEAAAMFGLEDGEGAEVGTGEDLAMDGEAGDTHSHDGHLNSHSHSHSHPHTHPAPISAAPTGKPDYEKLRSTLRQFVRDWSAE
ncbi:hypothetical protein BT69DRAFT_1306027, partial [Atractiella rhizophila]